MKILQKCRTVARFKGSWGSQDRLFWVFLPFQNGIKNEIDFSPQVEIFAYNKYKCFGDPDTLVESFDHNGTVERISAVIEAMNQG